MRPSFICIHEHYKLTTKYENVHAVSPFFQSMQKNDHIPSFTYKMRHEFDNFLKKDVSISHYKIEQLPFSLKGLSPGLGKPLIRTSVSECCSQYFMISSMHSDTRTL